MLPDVFLHMPVAGLRQAVARARHQSVNPRQPLLFDELARERESVDDESFRVPPDVGVLAQFDAV